MLLVMGVAGKIARRPFFFSGIFSRQYRSAPAHDCAAVSLRPRAARLASPKPSRREKLRPDAREFRQFVRGRKINGPIAVP
jgi:hypothetical protein